MSCICSHLPTIALNRWFDKWAEYASFRRGTNGEPATVCSPLKIQHIAPRPGAIDNSPLLDAQSSNLREGLSEGQDFTVINKETWELLHKWCVEDWQCATLHVGVPGHASCWSTQDFMQLAACTMHLMPTPCSSDASTCRYTGGPEIFRECAVEGEAEGGDRKVVAAVYFLRLTVHRSSNAESRACIVVSKQVRD
jgi:DUSP domain